MLLPTSSILLSLSYFVSCFWCSYLSPHLSKRRQLVKFYSNPLGLLVAKDDDDYMTHQIAEFKKPNKFLGLVQLDKPLFLLEFKGDNNQDSSLSLVTLKGEVYCDLADLVPYEVAVVKQESMLVIRRMEGDGFVLTVINQKGLFQANLKRDSDSKKALSDEEEKETHMEIIVPKEKEEKDQAVEDMKTVHAVAKEGVSEYANSPEFLNSGQNLVKQVVMATLSPFKEDILKVTEKEGDGRFAVCRPFLFNNMSRQKDTEHDLKNDVSEEEEVKKHWLREEPKETTDHVMLLPFVVPEIVKKPSELRLFSNDDGKVLLTMTESSDHGLSSPSSSSNPLIREVYWADLDKNSRPVGKELLEVSILGKWQLTISHRKEQARVTDMETGVTNSMSLCKGDFVCLCSKNRLCVVNDQTMRLFFYDCATLKAQTMRPRELRHFMPSKASAELSGLWFNNVRDYLVMTFKTKSTPVQIFSIAKDEPVPMATRKHSNGEDVSLRSSKKPQMIGGYAVWFNGNSGRTSYWIYPTLLSEEPLSITIQLPGLGTTITNNFIDLQSKKCFLLMNNGDFLLFDWKKHRFDLILDTTRSVYGAMKGFTLVKKGHDQVELIWLSKQGKLIWSNIADVRDKQTLDIHGQLVIDLGLRSRDIGFIKFYPELNNGILRFLVMNEQADTEPREFEIVVDRARAG